MANINVRAADQTVALLKELAEQTRDSQAQVIDKALIIYKEYLRLQERNKEKILKQI